MVSCTPLIYTINPVICLTLWHPKDQNISNICHILISWQYAETVYDLWIYPVSSFCAHKAAAGLKYIKFLLMKGYRVEDVNLFLFFNAISSSEYTALNKSIRE